MVDRGLMASSCRKPGTFTPPDHPSAYWPRAVVRSSRRGREMLWSTLSFSARRFAASKEIGSSMATSASSCSRWFWITSRAAPMPS